MDITFIKFVSIVCLISMLIAFILISTWIYIYKDKHVTENKINYIQTTSGFTRVIIINGNIRYVDFIKTLKKYDLQYITSVATNSAISSKEFTKILKNINQ